MTCGLHQEKYVKLVYLLIWGSTLFFGGTAVWALVWAIRNGQMSNLKAGAESIFDEEEPVGKQTDMFPGGDK
jgi:cbb3-type cytochrome oxidase maturation protein